MDIFLYSILAWYFDHIDNSNRGKTYKKLFFLDMNYWCRKNKKKKKIEEINDTSRVIEQKVQKLLEKQKSNSSSTCI